MGRRRRRRRRVRPHQALRLRQKGEAEGFLEGAEEQGGGSPSTHAAAPPVPPPFRVETHVWEPPASAPPRDPSHKRRPRGAAPGTARCRLGPNRSGTAQRRRSAPSAAARPRPHARLCRATRRCLRWRRAHQRGGRKREQRGGGGTRPQIGRGGRAARLPPRAQTPNGPCTRPRRGRQVGVHAMLQKRRKLAAACTALVGASHRRADGVSPEVSAQERSKRHTPYYRPPLQRAPRGAKRGGQRLAPSASRPS
mmetsp:Transcript_21275/g.62730  ORF Transcript_21275/g.62730 Transcript_21275/m.62730 type:complete len:252 (+) Transcript_21275:156-911(+)